VGLPFAQLDAENTQLPVVGLQLVFCDGNRCRHGSSLASGKRLGIRLWCHGSLWLRRKRRPDCDGIRIDIVPEIELAGVIGGLINLFEPIVRASENHGDHGLGFGSHGARGGNGGNSKGKIVGEVVVLAGIPSQMIKVLTEDFT